MELASGRRGQGQSSQPRKWRQPDEAATEAGGKRLGSPQAYKITVPLACH
jgi:hypothetical protein